MSGIILTFLSYRMVYKRERERVNQKMISKFKSTRITFDNKNFASKMEAALYVNLKAREQEKEIEDIKCQETVYLTDARIIYKPDFSFYNLVTQEKQFAESKGFETPEWRIKRRLWLHYGPGILEVWKGSHKKIFLHEILKPVIINAS